MHELILALAMFAGPLPQDDLPPLTDLDRFPPAEVARANWQFGRAHVEWVTGQLALQPGLDYDPWLTEARHLAMAWDRLDDAHSCRSPLAIRGHLRRLRELIGTAAYCQGEMPPCVPIWRFERR